MLDKWLGRIVNLALIAAAIVLLTQRFSPPDPPAPPPGLTVGSQVDRTPLGVAQTDPSIILVTSSGCRFCTASMPFYRTLQKEANNRGIPLIPLASVEGVEENEAYLLRHQVEIKRRPIDLASSGIRASGTPFLMLLDAKGIVVAAYPGKLPPKEEEAFLAKVVKLSNQG